jgi:hypothetical protein
MSRLIAFGCSYTYGHGLEDCHVEPNNPGLSHSKLAWPSLLANMLNLEVVNCSNPGASNIHIFWKLLNFKFNDDDLCVVMWSHFGRQPFSNLKYNSSIIEWDNYDRGVIKRLPELEEENLVIRNFISIHHGYSYLVSKNISHHFVIGTTDGLLYRRPIIAIPTLNDKLTIDSCLVDRALDNMHPGPKTHMAFAKKLFDNIHVH